MAIVVAQHHGPLARGTFDGLRNPHASSDVFATTKNITVLHGHSHRAEDRAWRGEQSMRIYSAPAVVDDDHPLRIYEVVERLLLPRHEQVTAAALC